MIRDLLYFIFIAVPSRVAMRRAREKAENKKRRHTKRKRSTPPGSVLFNICRAAVIFTDSVDDVPQFLDEEHRESFGQIDLLDDQMVENMIEKKERSSDDESEELFTPFFPESRLGTIFTHSYSHN